MYVNVRAIVGYVALLVACQPRMRLWCTWVAMDDQDTVALALLLPKQQRLESRLWMQLYAVGVKFLVALASMA